MKEIVVEAFIVGPGGSESGLGRIWTECACKLADSNVTLITNSLKGTAPCNTIIVNGKTPLVKGIYKIAKRLPDTVATKLKSIAHILHYRAWLKQVKKEVKTLHREKKITLAIHASYASFMMPSRLPEIANLPVAEVGCTQNNLAGKLLWLLRIRKPSHPLPTNKDTHRITGGILTLPPINTPTLKGVQKEKTILFVDSEIARKQAVCLKDMLDAICSQKREGSLLQGWGISILTHRPNYWEEYKRPEIRVIEKLPEDEYLAELEKASFILNVSRREGAPSACLEAMHLNTIPISTPLCWTRRCQTIPIQESIRPDPEIVHEAIIRAITTHPDTLQSMQQTNQAWVKKHTGEEVIAGTLNSILNQIEKGVS